MRHRKSGRHFNMVSSSRKAMFYNMSKDLIKYETIRTTLAKAKELRRYLEPLITAAKVDTLTNRRWVLSRLRDKRIVHKLFSVLGIRFVSRPGGYLRILKYRFRRGDGASIAIVELIKEE